MYPAPIQSLSRVRTFVTPWTVACQAPLSVGFSRQEYWSGLPFPSPGDLPNPGMESGSPALAGGFFATVAPGKACVYMRARACVCVCVLVAQPHPTLCRSVDYSLPGYSVCGISRQEYCSGFAMPSSRDLPDPGIKLESPVLQADPLPLGPPGSPVCICLYPHILCDVSLFQAWTLEPSQASLCPVPFHPLSVHKSRGNGVTTQEKLDL